MMLSEGAASGEEGEQQQQQQQQQGLVQQVCRMSRGAIWVSGLTPTADAWCWFDVAA
jgi:hypothetical protein